MCVRVCVSVSLCVRVCVCLPVPKRAAELIQHIIQLHLQVVQ